MTICQNKSHKGLYRCSWPSEVELFPQMALLGLFHWHFWLCSLSSNQSAPVPSPSRLWWCLGNHSQLMTATLLPLKQPRVVDSTHTTNLKDVFNSLCVFGLKYLLLSCGPVCTFSYPLYFSVCSCSLPALGVVTADENPTFPQFAK